MTEKNYFQEYLKETGLTAEEYRTWLLSQDKLTVLRRQVQNTNEEPPRELRIMSNSKKTLTFELVQVDEYSTHYKLDLEKESLFHGKGDSLNPLHFPVLTKGDLKEIKGIQPQTKLKKEYESFLKVATTLEDVLEKFPENVSANNMHFSLEKLQSAIDSIKEEIPEIEREYVGMFKSSLSELVLAEDQSQRAKDTQLELYTEQGLRASAEKKLAEYIKDYDEMLIKYDQAMKELEQRRDANKERDNLFNENERLKQEVQILKAECYDFAKTKKELEEIKQTIKAFKGMADEQ